MESEIELLITAKLTRNMTAIVDRMIFEDFWTGQLPNLF